jgi:hypothetical protein
VPILLIPLVAILFALVVAVGVPFSIVQRYRAGTARRQAKGWMAATNVFSLLISAGLFLVSAAITSVWVPRVFWFSALGMFAGSLLGFAGLALTRWEAAHPNLHFTPNRWLVLSITVAVAARIGFGFWRAWHAWHTAPNARTWLATAGLAGSMGAGALVLGYYLSFWFGVWLRVRSHNRSHRR